MADQFTSETRSLIASHLSKWTFSFPFSRAIFCSILKTYLIWYLNAKKLKPLVLTLDLYTNLLNSSVKWFLRTNSAFEESSSPKITSVGVRCGKLIWFLHQCWTDFHSFWVSWQLQNKCRMLSGSLLHREHKGLSANPNLCSRLFK